MYLKNLHKITLASEKISTKQINFDFIRKKYGNCSQSIGQQVDRKQQKQAMFEITFLFLKTISFEVIMLIR